MWSPDGTKIAFVSNHSEDPDKNENTDIFIMDAKAGAQARQLLPGRAATMSRNGAPMANAWPTCVLRPMQNYIMYDQDILCVQD